MRWQIRTAIMLLAMASGPLSAGADLREIKARGKLRALAVELKNHPFFSTNTPDRPGFDFEVVEGFARLQRLRLETVLFPNWDRLIPALLEGQGDVIIGEFTVTEARKQQIDFTIEAFPTRNIVLTRQPHPPVATLEQLRAVPTVGAIRGTTLWDSALEAGVAPSALVNMTVKADDELRAGRVAAAVQAVEIALPLLLRDPQLELGAFVGPPGSLAYGVRKEDAELRNALSDYVSNLRRGAGWNRLVVKYFGLKAIDVLKRARQ